MKRLLMLLIGISLIWHPVQGSMFSWTEEGWDGTMEADDFQGAPISFDVEEEDLLASGMEEDFASEDLLLAEEIGLVAAADSDPGNMKETVMEPDQTTTITSSTYGVYYFSLKDLEPSANDLYVFSVFSEVPTIGTLYRLEKDSNGEVLDRTFHGGVDANKVDIGNERTILSTNYHYPCQLSDGRDYVFVVEKADSDASSSAEVFFTIKPLQEGLVIEEGHLTPEVGWTAVCLAPSLPDNLMRIRLKIEGSGEIPSYNTIDKLPPWAGLSFNIEEVALDKVTGVGDEAFCILPRLFTVYLPSTLEKLGFFSFYCEHLAEVMYARPISSLANLCPIRSGNMIDGLYRVFNPRSPWGKEVFAYKQVDPTEVVTLYNENTGLGKVMFYPFTLEDLGFAPGAFTVTFKANGHIEGSVVYTDTSNAGQEAPHYPAIKSVNNLDHVVTSQETLSFDVDLEAGRKYWLMLNACFEQSSDTKSVEAYYSIAPKDARNLVLDDSPITLTAKAKKQTFTLQATAKGKLTYKSDNSKVKVSKAGLITIPKNFAGKAIITVTAAKAPGYEKESKQVTVLVNPAAVKLKNVTSTKAKQMKVSWSKNTNASGYVISYATKSSFANEKTVKVSSSKASTTIKKLTSKKKYYVRIRSYKKVGKEYFYSEWSKTLKVKVK